MDASMLPQSLRIIVPAEDDEELEDEAQEENEESVQQRERDSENLEEAPLTEATFGNEEDEDQDPEVTQGLQQLRLPRDWLYPQEESTRVPSR